MAKYNGSGWHRQSIRHSNARKYGRAGGTYKVVELPIYQIKGKQYYRDVRLGEYRNVKDPNDRLDINIPNSMLEKPTIPHPADVKKKFISDFENMKDNAELRALSNISLQRQLNDKEYQRFMELGRKAGIMVNVKTKKNFGGYTPNYIKGGLADGVKPSQLNQEALAKGVSVELEHTNNPTLAREIATDHLVENHNYYDKLEKIEAKPEPINVKIPKHQVIRDKNQLEKDLQSQIKKTIDVDEKKRLEKMYRELRKADSHTKFKRFINEYGNTLSTIGMALPFYIVSPLATAGVLIGATVTGDVPMTALIPRLAVPMTVSIIGMEGIKHSVRTINAIKKREREIINEKTKELRENTTLPEKEIKKIAKRIAQQELTKTTITHELV
jgi:hypothetical protein